MILAFTAAVAQVLVLGELVHGRHGLARWDPGRCEIAGLVWPDAPQARPPNEQFLLGSLLVLTTRPRRERRARGRHKTRFVMLQTADADPSVTWPGEFRLARDRRLVADRHAQFLAQWMAAHCPLSDLDSGSLGQAVATLGPKKRASVVEFVLEMRSHQEPPKRFLTEAAQREDSTRVCWEGSGMGVTSACAEWATWMTKPHDETR